MPRVGTALLRCLVGVLIAGCTRGTAPASPPGAIDAITLHSTGVCDAETRRNLERQLAHVPDVETLRGIVRTACLEPVGARWLLDTGDAALWAWFGWTKESGGGVDWLQHVVRDPGAPLESVTLPPTLRASAARIIADDPAATVLGSRPDGTCEPTTHWVAEAERMLELEAYDKGTWTPRHPDTRTITALGFPRGDPELGEPCRDRLAREHGEPSDAVAWQACLLRSRARRALMPAGSLCAPTTGRLEVGWVHVRKCEDLAAYDGVDVAIDLADGRVEWQERCGPKRPPRARVPTDVVRRTAFYMLVGPHVVVGAPSKEDVEVPSGLGGGPVLPVSVSETILPPYEHGQAQASHTVSFRYRVATDGGAREGVCHRRGYGAYGEAATCAALSDLIALVMESDGR